MAGPIVSDTAKAIADSLSSLLQQEIGLVYGFKDELEKLRNSVSTIQAVLLDAEERRDKSHALKDWLGKLKNVMEDAEDLLDDFPAEALRREVMPGNKKLKEVRIFFSKSNQLAYGHKMGHKIKAVRERLDAISSDRHQFHFTERSTETQLEFRERDHTHSFVREDEVIGREDEKKDVIKLLLDANVKENVAIIPLVRIGGLGKTMLAQYVYGDEEVQRHFDLKIWACVSETFNIKNIVAKIIRSATKERSENLATMETPENLDMDLLQSQLRKKIDGKRYLLVLDDVWNENNKNWINLKDLLMGGLKGSKILITTRSIMVAQITGTIPPYKLEGLSKESCWNLFKKMAFKDAEVVNPNLKKIGKEIVKKCVRVPLVIRSIGSLLSFKNSEADWLYFKNNEISRISQSKNEILATLKLSYDHLPFHLKQCFAFCSLFPKDFRIDVRKLVWMWIAEGFIHLSNEEKCLEDVGYEYFMHLFWRSFFQDINRDYEGNILSCKMHDLMHDVAQSIAGNEYKIGNLEVKNIERTRYVTFELDSLRDFPTPLLKAEKMRTFLLPRQTWQSGVMNPRVCDTLISSFKCLRVLNLSNSNIQTIPTSIGKLKHLRYLDLSANEKIQLLPDSITELLHLQTLYLFKCKGLKELPKDTRNLVSLRCLDLYRCDSLTHMPNGLGELKHLQTLTCYVLPKRKGFASKQKSGLSDLNELNDLKYFLDIKDLEQLRSSPEEAKVANLKMKQFLGSLKLEWEVEVDIYSDSTTKIDELLLKNLQPHPKLVELHIVGYAGVRLASWVPSLSNLACIKLQNCERCKCIPPLDRFPCLQDLILIRLISLEYISNDCNDQSIPSLHNLNLEDLPNLKGWCKMGELVTTKQKHHHHHQHHLLLPSFSSLRKLYITKCSKISMISIMMTTQAQGSKTTPSSSSFSAFPKLEFLEINSMNQLKSLPEWIGELTSLRSLQISKCPKIMSLPKEIGNLKSLRDLTIKDCPDLEKRCEKGKGKV